MIYNVTNSILQRDDVIKYIKDNNFKNIVDVGGVLGPWAREVVNCYVDLLGLEDGKNHDPNTADEKFMGSVCFKGVDVSNYRTWPLVKDKFDFAICTQMLEHCTNPQIALEFLATIAKEGFVGVPNKFTELRRGISFTEEGLNRCGVSGHWRGFVPHRWICTVRDGALWFWPKLNFLEYLEGIDEWVNANPTSVELSFWWKDSIPCNVITDYYIDHPDPQRACELYRNELKIGL